MPRILVTSISCWNDISGSNTWSSLLGNLPADDLANLYINPGMPTSTVCSRYFNINEWRVVKSIFNRKVQTGNDVFSDNSHQEKVITEEAVPSSVLSKRWRVFLLAREVAWKFGRWDSRELDVFLDDIRPDVLLFSAESYFYFNRINEYIINRCQPAKVVCYLWDDNFTYKQHPHSSVFKIERYFLRKQVRRLINSCTDVLAISPKMKEECDKEFGVDSIVITKPIFNCGEFEDYQAGTPVRILYTGKLIIGRDDTVIEVVKAIKEINKDSQKAILDIYTNTQLSEDKKAKIAVEGCCNLHDPVPQSEVAALQKNADVLLFAESLSDRDLTARLSFSTKLTDYFAAGKCIWAVGNGDLGPISYIKTEDAGVVSTDNKEIGEVLEKIVGDKNLISEYARKGYDCGKRNHNGDEVIARLHEVLKGND